MSLSANPVWPWPLLVLLAAGFAYVQRVIYHRRSGSLTPRRRLVLTILRSLALLLLLFLAFRPSIVFSRQDRTDTVLYVMTDSSRSMQTPDGPGGTTRRDAMLNTLNTARDAFEELTGNNVEIRFREYADVLTATVFPEGNADGSLTAIGANLSDLADEAGNEKVAGVIFLGDGASRAIGARDIDPRQMARLFARQQRPIYSVVYGSGELSDTSTDLALEALDVSRDVFVRNVVPIKVTLKTAGAMGQPIRVRALLEDRRGMAMGQSGPMVPVSADGSNEPVAIVTPTEANQSFTVELQIAPEFPDVLKLRIEAEPIQGELRTTNNTVETIIRVRRGGIRVAYFDQLRTEQKFLRGITKSSRVQLDFRWVPAGSSGGESIDDKFFRPGEYDAYIIGDVPASAFSREQLNQMYQNCNAGSGLMMIGGMQSFGPGGWGQTSIARLLPVELQGAAVPPGVLDPQRHIQTPLKMIPTPDGLTHYVMQIDSPQRTRARWESLDPLVRGNRLIPRRGGLVEILAATPDGIPLLVGHDIGPTRVLAFAGDSTWQWQMRNGDREALQRFWRQAIFWITHKDTDTDQKVWVRAEPQIVPPGQPVELTFGARDETGRMVPDMDYTVEITSPSQEPRQVVPRIAAGQPTADFGDTSITDEYWVRVRAEKDGIAHDHDAYTRVLVDQSDPELDNPAADPALMRELAHLSGGDFVTPDELLERLKSWAEQGLPSNELERRQHLQLWDNWLVLLTLVTLLTIEWTFRKRWGLI